MLKKYFLEKNGCNIHDNEFERLKKDLESISYSRTTDIFSADLIIEYFCAISAENLKRIVPKMKIITAIKNNNPEVKCIVGGCASGKKVVPFKELYPNAVDLEFTRSQFPDTLLEYLEIETKKDSNDIFVNVKNNSAFVKIQEGCLRHCSFCKAAYCDMTLRSIPIEVIVKNIAFAISNGAKYVTLTGENTTEYGIDIYGKCKLLELLKEIEKLDGDFGIALFGICIEELDKETIEFISNSKHIKKLQIEAQSFMPMVRDSMGLSKSNTEIAEILNAFSSKSIISNVMIGHPIDSEKYTKSEIDTRFWSEFDNSVQIIKENNFYFLSLNILDATPQTKSYYMPQISDSDKEKMLNKLYECLKDLISKQIEKMISNKTLVSAYFVKFEQDFYVFEAVDYPILIKVPKEEMNCKINYYDIRNINVVELSDAMFQNGKDMQYIIVIGKIV